MLGQKMYIVTDADLMQATQKQPKILSFLPIEAKAASRICGVSEESERIFYHNANGEEGETAILKETHAARRAALSPSPEFDKMNQRLVQNIQASLYSVGPSEGQPIRIGLSAWLRRNVTSATTNSVYGPQNPFRDELVVDGIWYIYETHYMLELAKISTRQINKNITPLLLGVLTSITASKGLAGRTVVTKAFEQYFQNGGHIEGSTSTKDRYETAVKHGVALKDIAKFEVGEAIATLTNTAPACFWTLFFIYSTPGLLDEIRMHLDTIFDENDKSQRPFHDLNIESLKKQCPLLVSTISETLRYCSLGGSVRQVMEDTVLEGRWLLKKGSIIQMPSRILHKDPSIWGDDVDDFDPRRFQGDQRGQKPRSSRGKPPNTAAFRPFGGGTTLCPGRHFATNTILVVAAMFVMYYELLPVAGVWSIPSAENTTMSEFMMEPDTDIEVDVVPRKGFEEKISCLLS